MTYRVLKPKIEKSGEVTYAPDGPMYWYRVAEWLHVGYAENMEDAKQKFGAGLRHGRAPVLEWVGRQH